MDKSTDPHHAPGFEIRGHHHRARGLPRPWITLPPSVCRAARSEPLLSALFPSHVGFFPRASGHRVQRAGIDSTIVNYCVKGRGFCELLGRQFVIEPGDVMIVPSGTPHAYGAGATDPWSIYWLHAMGESVPELLRELCVSAERPVAHLGKHGELVALFSELRQTLEHDYSRPQMLYASRVLAYLFGVMIRLRREANERDDSDTAAKVKKTLEHMRRHIERPMLVETLAAMAGLSASQYTARFRRVTGYAPKNYLVRMRLHRAAQLLDTTTETVGSIALRVGYADALHFSRAFRRLHDVSPSDYRRARDRRRV